MRDNQVSKEFDVDWIVALYLLLEVVDQFGKHFFEHGKFDDVVDGEDLHSDRLVDGQDLLDGWAVISDENTSSLLELTLLQIGLREFHEVRV